MRTHPSNYKPWLFGVALGAAIALIVTLTVTIGEWHENPGGVFQGPEGINWRNVAETAGSWFIPTFLFVTAVCVGLILAWTTIRRLRTNSKTNRPS